MEAPTVREVSCYCWPAWLSHFPALPRWRAETRFVRSKNGSLRSACEFRPWIPLT